MVPTIIGANDRDLPIGTANNKDELFALFGPDAHTAHKIYDPRGDQTLDELKQQVFADRMFAEPVRHFTNSGVIVGTDPLKPRLDLWQKVWSQGR
jgi:para-nitrobenzyl esterase